MVAAEIAVFVFCLIGCGYSSYTLGKREGITATVEELIKQGILEVDDEDTQ